METPTNKRIQLYNYITQNLTDQLTDWRLCEKDGNLGNVRLLKYIGSESVAGQVKLACTLNQSDKNVVTTECKCKTCRPIAVKIIELEGKDLNYFANLDSAALNPFTTESSAPIPSSIHVEMTLLALSTLAVQQRTCPNLPLLYSYHLCEKNGCSIKQKYGNIRKLPCIYLLTELADGDLDFWFKKERTIDEIYNCLFQIYAGLYYLLKHYG